MRQTGGFFEGARKWTRWLAWPIYSGRTSFGTVTRLPLKRYSSRMTQAKVVQFHAGARPFPQGTGRSMSFRTPVLTLALFATSAASQRLVAHRGAGLDLDRELVSMVYLAAPPLVEAVEVV